MSEEQTLRRSSCRRLAAAHPVAAHPGYHNVQVQ